MMKNGKILAKRSLAAFLAFVMCLGMLNLTVFAAEDVQPGHTHGEDGWDCTQAEGAPKLICEEHQHGESCYEIGSKCALEEHEHTEECFGEEVIVWTCGTEAHVHGDECNAAAQGELACEIEEHRHDGDCYAAGETKQTCTEAEHEHSDNCYQMVDNLICGLEETEDTTEMVEYTVTKTRTETMAVVDDEGNETGETKEVEVEYEETETKEVIVPGHTHDNCYETVRELNCEIEAHKHGDECYVSTQGELVCEIETHEHGNSCYAIETETVCTKEAHTHSTDACEYKTEQGELICTKTPHTHDGESCETEEVETCVCDYPDSTHVHDEKCYTVTEGEWTCIWAGGPVYNEAELKQAIETAGTEPTTITVAESFDAASFIQVKAGQDITLVGKPGVAIGRANECTVSFVWVNGSLTLKDIAIDGNNVPSSTPAVYVASTGTFTMEDGAVIRNNLNDYSTKKYYGGGVYNNGGTFIMNGGSITGNTAKSYGGGVANSGGTFTMNGGVISGNKNPTWYGGGVWNNGTFYMYGGTISENEASNTTYGYGGGVANIGTFNMGGSKDDVSIIGNTATKFGGGVYSTGTLNVTGGEISVNKGASGGGGGVYDTGKITMNGTKVFGNVNGGIYIKTATTADAIGITPELTNLTITDNTGKYPALYCSTVDSVTITGCTISDNVLSANVVEITGSATTATSNTLKAAVKTMKDCVISNNTASAGNSVLKLGGSAGHGPDEGGLYVTGCTITGNKGATYGGLNVSPSGDTYISDTLIEGNTGLTYGGMYISAASNAEYFTTLTNTVIKNNTATGTTGVGGIGLVSKAQLFYNSGALYNNTGKKANDFNAATEMPIYTLPAASEMYDFTRPDADFAALGYVWMGAPAGLEGEQLTNTTVKTAISLTAQPNMVRQAAQIGDSQYATLEEALNAAEDGDEIIVIWGDDGFGKDNMAVLENPIKVTDKAITIRFDGQYLNADGGTLFTVGNGGRLTLMGTTMMNGTITVDGGDLTMDGSITPYYFSGYSAITKDLIVDVQSGSFTINGKVVAVKSNLPLKVNLAKGTYITAGEEFSVGSTGIKITLDDETYKTFNDAGLTDAPDDVMLIMGCGDEAVLSKLDLGFTNSLVKAVVESSGKTRSVGGNIVLHKEVLSDGIRLGPNEEYTTFAAAKAAALAAGEPLIIYVTGELSESGEWDGEGLTLMRGPSYHGILVRVTGSLTLRNITLDGGSSYAGSNNGPLVYAQSGTVILDEGAELKNNDVSQNTVGSPVGPVYPAHGGGVNVLGGRLVMNEGAKIENCTAQYGGAVALTAHGGHMYMHGGEIKNNAATVSGGGIAASVAYNAPQFANVLDVLGGTFERNYAYVTGGAIYVQCSNGITIGDPKNQSEEVLFEGNSADGENGGKAFSGGALYVNGGTSGYVNGKAQLYNVVITNNTAGTWAPYSGGGGIAGCLSANITIHLTNGAAIYGNKGPGDVNSDVLTTSINHANGVNGSGSSKVQISPVMLGGGAYNWRYASNGRAVPLDYLDNADRNLNIYSGVSVSDPSIQAANELAGVVFKNNTGKALGGAIGTNGDVVIGTSGEPAETVNLYVEKQWVDNGVQHAEIDKIEVKILRYVGDNENDAEWVMTICLKPDENNEWKDNVNGLPKYDKAGNEYTYTVAEVEVPDGYTVKVSETSEAGYEFAFTITNTYVPDTGELSIHKTVTGITTTADWHFTVTLSAPDGIDLNDGVYTVSIDGGEQSPLNITSEDGKTAVVEITLKHGQTATIYGIPSGTTYKVVEAEANQGQFVTTPSGDSGTIEKDAPKQANFTNRYWAPEDPTMDISVEKVWRGDENIENVVHPDIRVQLLLNGNVVDEVTLSEGNWSHIWRNQPIGNYTVKEVNAPAGYTSEVTGGGTAFIITNTYVEPDEPDDTISLTVIKEWRGDENAENVVHPNIRVRLLQDGNYYAEVTLSEGNWSYTWTNLPQNHVYTVVEVDVPENYTSEVGDNINGTITITNTYDEPDLDIPDPDVPLTPGDDEEFDIPEDDVPLASVPKTGDDSSIWGILTLMSGAGLALMALRSRKRSESAE